MTLLESLLDAIVRLDGDALVMHVGEKPYVVTTSSAMNAFRGPLAWGQVELSSRVLTPDAVLSMVGQILPAEQRNALDEVGAVEHEIAGPQGVSDRFTVVAARGGDDIWLELRRHPEATPAAAGGAVALESERAPAVETAPATEKDFDRSVSTAVGLQEPPDAESPEPAGSVEASAEAPHIIPLPEEPEDEHAGRDEAPLELVEAEAQHAPTDEDVDAMLAATAASLLAAGRRPEAEPPADAGAPPDGIFLAETFEIVIEEEDEEHDAEQDRTGDVEDFDLTSELAGMPPAPWTSAPVEEPPAVDDDDAAPGMALPREMPSAPPAGGDVAAEPEPAPSAEPGASEGAVEITPAPEADMRPAPAAATPLDEAPSVEEPQAQAVQAQEPAVQEVEAAPPSGESAAFSEPEPEPAPSEPEAHPADAEEPVVPTVPQAAVAAEAAQPEPAVEAPAEEEAPGEVVPGSEETSVDSITALPRKGAAAESAAPPIAARAPAVPDRGAPAAVAQAPQERIAAAAVAPQGDERLLQILGAAADRGASTIYAVAGSKPMLRVDGEIAPLEQEPPLTAQDIDRFAAALTPAGAGGAVREGAEWMTAVAGVGRVRCVAFRDHRGPGLILRLISSKSISADHLNLSPEIRELCTLADGLVLVAGPRGSGRSTLLNSFVDLINRTRSEHVVTVETEIAFAHDSQRSFVSQREARGDAASVAAAVKAAVREDADVLVVEDVQSPETAAAAIEAAASGRLVFASVAAPSSAGAVEAVLNLVAEGERAAMRTALAGVLRGVVTQVLVKKASGGRVAARELLLNSPAVAAAVRNGDAPGIATALESGAASGMLSLTEALVSLVRGGTVHASEASRRAPDRQAILEALAREGVDTSFAERLA